MIVLLICGVALIIGSVLAIVLCRENGLLVRHSYALPVTALLAASSSCVICFLSQGSLVAALLSVAFLVAGTVLLLAFLFWKICYTEETFEVHSFLKRKKVYTMCDVIGITEGKSTTWLHLQNGKKIPIDAKNAGDFIDAVETHYRTVQKKGAALPDIPARLFHGYIQNPGQFVFIFCLVLAFELCTLVALVLYSSVALKLPDDLIELRFAEFSATLDSDTLEIQTGELEQPFVCISFRRVLSMKGQTAEAFLNELSQQKEITVSASNKMLQKAYADNCKVLKIYQLNGDNGDFLLQHQEISAGTRANYTNIIFTSAALFVLTLLFVFFFGYVVSNAPQYPRLVRLLVKEDWLNV